VKKMAESNSSGSGVDIYLWDHRQDAYGGWTKVLTGWFKKTRELNSPKMLGWRLIDWRHDLKNVREKKIKPGRRSLVLIHEDHAHFSEEAVRLFDAAGIANENDGRTVVVRVSNQSDRPPEGRVSVVRIRVLEDPLFSRESFRAPHPEPLLRFIERLFPEEKATRNTL
jgi:hypothetical protein